MAKMKKREANGASTKTKLTPDVKTRFLRELAENGGIVVYAAKTIDVSRTSLYLEREADPEFKKTWDRCVDIGFDLLEDEAKIRAYEGVDEPLSHLGLLTGDVIKRKSDALMIVMLRAHRIRYTNRLAVEQEGVGEVAIILPDNGRGDGPLVTTQGPIAAAGGDKKKSQKKEDRCSGVSG